METNEGSVDRVLRIIVGFTLIALALIGPKTPWGYLGMVPLFTGLIGTCPLYSVLGLSTCPAPRRQLPRART